MALTEEYKVDKEDTEEKELYLVWRTWWEISWEAHGRHMGGSILVVGFLISAIFRRLFPLG
jgi:hypothetical protein